MTASEWAPARGSAGRIGDFVRVQSCRFPVFPDPVPHRAVRRNFLTRHPPANAKIPPHGAEVGWLRRDDEPPISGLAEGRPRAPASFSGNILTIATVGSLFLREDFVNRALGPRPYVVERPTMPNVV